MQEMAPKFSKFSRGGGGGGGGGGVGRAPRIITLQSIFETWQACHLLVGLHLLQYNILNTYTFINPGGGKSPQY